MKQALVERIRLQLADQLARLRQSARETHADATDPGSRAESKYDTRSLEASYLAQGQARQAEELAEALRIFEQLELPAFDIDAAIDAGALVELDEDGEPRHYLLVPAAGGTVIEDEGREVTLLTPESPLYRQLIGRRIGELVGDAMVSEVA